MLIFLWKFVLLLQVTPAVLEQSRQNSGLWQNWRDCGSTEISSLERYHQGLALWLISIVLISNTIIVSWLARMHGWIFPLCPRPDVALISDRVHPRWAWWYDQIRNYWIQWKLPQRNNTISPVEYYPDLQNRYVVTDGSLRFADDAYSIAMIVIC